MFSSVMLQLFLIDRVSIKFAVKKLNRGRKITAFRILSDKQLPLFEEKTQ